MEAMVETIKFEDAPIRQYHGQAMSVCSPTYITTAKPKVRYPVVRNKLTDWIIPRLLPERFLDRLIAKEVGMTRK